MYEISNEFLSNKKNIDAEDDCCYNIQSKITAKELNDNVDKHYINEFFMLLKLEEDEIFDVFKQDEFIIFKNKVIDTFKSNIIFPQKEKKFLKEVYIDKLEPCEDIKSLCKTLLSLYTLGAGPRKEVLLYYVLNKSLNEFDENKIPEFKYLIICFLLNFNKLFNQNLKSIERVQRKTFLDIEIFSSKMNHYFFSNQFLSTTLIDNQLGEFFDVNKFSSNQA